MTTQKTTKQILRDVEGWSQVAIGMVWAILVNRANLTHEQAWDAIAEYIQNPQTKTPTDATTIEEQLEQAVAILDAWSGMK
jgi:hypothetical protein